MVTQEEVNHMQPTVQIVTRNMATHIEDKPLPYYLVNTVIYTYTGYIL